MLKILLTVTVSANATTVFVYDEESSTTDRLVPILKAMIKIEQLRNNTWVEITAKPIPTGKDGRAAIPPVDLKKGAIRLTVSKKGYESSEVVVREWPKSKVTKVPLQPNYICSLVWRRFIDPCTCEVFFCAEYRLVRSREAASHSLTSSFRFPPLKRIKKPQWAISPPARLKGRSRIVRLIPHIESRVRRVPHPISRPLIARGVSGTR